LSEVLNDVRGRDHRRAGKRLIPVIAASAVTLGTAGLLTAMSTAGAVGARPHALTGHTTKVVVDSARRGKLGVVVETSKGFTLYRYSPDTSKKVACLAGCDQAWPPLTLPKGVLKATAGPGVTQKLLGTVKRPGGALQVTYRGYPLYRYAGDSGPGQTNGQGIGGVWHVVAAKGPSAANLSATTSASGYGGY